MKRVGIFLTIAYLLVSVAAASVQLAPIPEDRGAAGLRLALRKLGTTAIFLQTMAHPDDEDNGLLVMLSRGRGLRSALLTVTRGSGGQNLIGPEIGEALGVLRTAELMAMHRIDGVEQYFTRAIDFGYSFSVEESLQKWGEEAILGDIVRIIRTVRPDVVTTMAPGGTGGGQHHQTTARLTIEAFRAAADPSRFPEQIADGLRPWQALKLYTRAFSRQRDDPPGAVRIDTGRYDPVLGRSYHQMGIEARSYHRCQSMSQIRALPGGRMSTWLLEDSVDSVDGPENDLFDGIEMGLERLADFVEEEKAAAGFLSSGLVELERHVEAAQGAFAFEMPWWRTLDPLREALTTVRKIREEVAESSLSELARYELDFRLSRKENDIVTALALAHGLGFDPVSEKGDVVPGATFEVHVQVANRSPEPIQVDRVELVLPEGWESKGDQTGPSSQLGLDETVEMAFEVGVPPQAEESRLYWAKNPTADRFDFLEPEHFGLPFSPPRVRARLVFRSGSAEAVIDKPVEYRYPGSWVGTEKQKEVSVLPVVSLAVSPKVVVFPTKSGEKAREISVSLLYKGSGQAEGTLRLETPAGWKVAPEQASIRFGREDEAASVSFEVTPPDSVAAGAYEIQALASLGGKDYREGYQTIAYHHLETRYLFHPARVTVQALDIEVAPVTVGYIMGVGDDVPGAIRQLGAELVLLEEEDLAAGDLTRFDLVITGIRAYQVRDDLRAYNQRLLDYVEGGGTMLVQYSRTEFNEAQWGPYPIQTSRNRITVEEAPMRILDPSHPVFHFPNAITEDDWKDWVQERGTYFIGERDERYRDLLASEDPWEYNKGEKRGILVEARHGKGRWLYTGLGFFRQLPAGVPDAYKLFANLLSLPKAEQSSGQAR